MDDNQWSTALISSLNRMRGYLIVLLLLFVVASTGGYFLSEAAMSYVFKMVRQVVFISPTEAFITKVKVSLAIGFVFVLPALLYTVVKEIGRHDESFSRKMGILFAFGSTILFLAGGIFCFYAIVPVALRFLLGFATLEMQPLLSAGRLVSFVLLTVLAFGATFELPVIILVLARLGFVNESLLRKKRKYAILAIFIVAGILTPSPDVLSQILMAVPLMILYELGIFLTKWCAKRVPETCSIPPDQQQLYM